jgi:hypothetical protein
VLSPQQSKAFVVSPPIGLSHPNGSASAVPGDASPYLSNIAAPYAPRQFRSAAAWIEAGELAKRNIQVSLRVPLNQAAAEMVRVIFLLLQKLLLAIVLLLITTLPCDAAMDFAKQVLIGADFHGADLKATTFSLTNLREANFKAANLEGASLFGAKLQDADFSYANMRGTTLDSAVFDGTNLNQTILEDAFAFNTRFKNVSIIGADFTNVPLREDSLKTLCSLATGVNETTGRNTIDTLGCF